MSRLQEGQNDLQTLVGLKMPLACCGRLHFCGSKIRQRTLQRSSREDARSKKLTSRDVEYISTLLLDSRQIVADRLKKQKNEETRMSGYANILEAVLAGEVLEAQSDWNLAVNMLAERIGDWNSNALGKIFTTNDEEVREDLLRTALVIIEIMERLDFMATDVFKFDPDGNPVWQSMRQETGQVFDQLVESMATMFGIKDIDTWVQEHFLEVGFIRMKK